MIRLKRFIAFLWLLFPLAPELFSFVPQEETEKMEGQRLAAELRNQKPTQNAEFTAVLKIREAQSRRTEIVLRFHTLLREHSWEAVYETEPMGKRGAQKLIVVHAENGPNRYLMARSAAPEIGLPEPMVCTQLMTAFAGSDFFLADLGLEFFHWPEQRLKKTELRRGRSCKVLESINPAPSPGDYARVLSWIDTETESLLRAEAYNKEDELLKEFSIGSFKKIKGRWELQDMEIRNAQSDSRTRLEFDLDQ
jgi:hypothetical protein